MYGSGTCPASLTPHPHASAMHHHHHAPPPPPLRVAAEANYIHKRDDVYSANALTDEDRVRIIELSRDPRIGEGQGGWVGGRRGRQKGKARE